MGSTFNTLSELQGTYSVFTGTDILTVFQDLIVSTMQGISYSITRQKAPVYVMGRADAVSIARSKRGIAGSMIMTTFDRHCLADFMRSSLFAAKKQSIENSSLNPYGIGGGNPVTPAGLASITQGQDPFTAAQSLSSTALEAITGEATSMSVSEPPMFTDQLLPFDATLLGSNEYGVGAKMRIFGLEVLNEGSGVSIDDTSNEVQMTYIARLITPWVNQEKLT